MIKQIFYSATERRIRSFWRLLITGLVSFIAVIICSIVNAVIQLVTERPLMAFLAGAPITLGFIFVSVTLGGLLVDRRKLSDFGLRIDNQWLKDLAFGLTLGFVLVTGVVIIEFVAGWVHQAGQPSRLHPEEPRTLELFTFVVLFICVGIYEELAFRGYLLKNLAEGWNWRVIGPNIAVVAAALVTSLLFGVVHGMNPHATAISVGNTVLSGLLLSLGLLLTGELAIPIGYHITWNLTQSVVYGLPVSGMSLGGDLVGLENSGPAWLTGGDYGPEGGLLCTFALVLGMFLTPVWVRLNKRPLCIDERLAEVPTNAIVFDEVAVKQAEQMTDEVNGSPQPGEHHSSG